MSVHPGNTRRDPAKIDARDLSITRTTPIATIIYRVSRAAINEHAPSGPSPILELRITINRDRVAIDLHDPKGETRALPSPDAPIQIENAPRGWMHIDAPGVISCSIADADTPAPALVYARTNVLGTLGIAGGRFDPPTLRSDG